MYLKTGVYLITHLELYYYILVYSLALSKRLIEAYQEIGHLLIPLLQIKDLYNIPVVDFVIVRLAVELHVILVKVHCVFPSRNGKGQLWYRYVNGVLVPACQ